MVRYKIQSSEYWTETVTYIKCPYCNDIKELGNDILLEETEKLNECNKCHRKYKAKVPEE